MEEFILFIMCFSVIYIIYQIFVVRKAKKNKKKKPTEVNYLIYKYHIDIDKLNYKRLLKCISFVSSFDISILVTISFIFNSFIYKILVIFLLMIPLILCSYHIIGIYYTRKGLIKSE